MFDFAARRPSRRPSLTPMIDVVFLLLVFFMLAARFGQDATLALGNAGSGARAPDTPRLVTLSAGEIALNGAPMTLAVLMDRLSGSQRGAAGPVFLQPDTATTLQQMVDVIDALENAGLGQIILVPQR